LSLIRESRQPSAWRHAGCKPSRHAAPGSQRLTCKWQRERSYELESQPLCDLAHFLTSIHDGTVRKGTVASTSEPKQQGENVSMATDRDESVPTSSIVMKAIDAKTFTELQSFVKDLESRPTERLLIDLPHLVALSEAKAEIISYVIATKFRHADPEERRTIRDSVSATSQRLPAGEERARVTHILERISNFAQ
jgi:hypothetical protein